MTKDNNIIYLKDALKDKTPTQILEMLPFMVCIETVYTKKHLQDVYGENSRYAKEDKVERSSYDVIGVSKDAILLGDEIQVENDDDFAWSRYYTADGYMKIPLNKLANEVTKDENGEKMKVIRYIFCSACTPKQKDFLVKYCNYDKDDVISGYEAFHIISDTIEDWKAQKEYREKHPYQGYYSRFDDPNYEPEEWDDCYDAPNM